MLDGSQFVFGPATFRQANLDAFEHIIRDMKEELAELIYQQNLSAPRLLELCGGVGVLGLSLVTSAGPGQSYRSQIHNVWGGMGLP